MVNAPVWKVGKMEKRRVLIVEDDAMSLRAWETVFGRRGWEVQLAGSVAEAMEMLDPAPDYLILDLRLPDGSGKVILRRVRKDGLKTRDRWQPVRSRSNLASERR